MRKFFRPVPKAAIFCWGVAVGVGLIGVGMGPPPGVPVTCSDQDAPTVYQEARCIADEFGDLEARMDAAAWAIFTGRDARAQRIIQEVLARNAKQQDDLLELLERLR